MVTVSSRFAAFNLALIGFEVSGNAHQRDMVLDNAKGTNIILTAEFLEKLDPQPKDGHSLASDLFWFYYTGQN